MWLEGAGLGESNISRASSQEVLPGCSPQESLCSTVMNFRQIELGPLRLFKIISLI
jgi:hypothetical protein